MSPRCVRALPLVAALACAGATAVAQSGMIAFDGAPIGAPPQDFVFAAQRLAGPGVWEVQGAGAARHLMHLADPTAPPRGISIALPHTPAFANVRVVARIRLAEGEQAGGLVWRYRDEHNFYAVAIDLMLRDVGLFRVNGGNRIRLDHSADATLDAAVWHQVVVLHVGDQIRVHVDGINVLTTRDPLAPERGRAGVWSAGGSLSWFDDIRIDEVPERRR